MNATGKCISVRQMKKIQGKAVDKPSPPSIVESSADRSRSEPSSTLTLAFEDCNPFGPSHNTDIKVEMKGLFRLYY